MVSVFCRSDAVLVFLLLDMLGTGFCLALAIFRKDIDRGRKRK